MNAPTTTTPALALSMSYHLCRIHQAEVRGASHEHLAQLWRRGARPGTSPVWPVLCVAWREAGESTIHLRIAREYATRRGRGRAVLAFALFVAFGICWSANRVLPSDVRVQIVAYDIGDDVPLVVEQAPRPRFH